MGSVGQRAAKLLVFKVGGLKKKSAAPPRLKSNQSTGFESFSNLTGGNFAAL